MQSESQQPASAAALAARLIEAFETSFDVDGTPTDIGASIGIALYPDNGHAAEHLLANADMALYRAKNRDGAAPASSNRKWIWRSAAAGAWHKS